MTSTTSLNDVANKIASVVNRGAWNGSITTSGGSVTIPSGYHNGSGKVTGPTLATLVGTSVNCDNNARLLSGYTAYGKNGVKYTGSHTCPSSTTVFFYKENYKNGSGVYVVNLYVNSSRIINGSHTTNEQTFSGSSGGHSYSIKVDKYVSGSGIYNYHIYRDSSQILSGSVDSAHSLVLVKSV